MKLALARLRRRLLKLKVYVKRTTTYVALVNAGMILFLFLSKLKELGIIGFDVDKYFVPIFAVGFFLLILIGWFDINYFKGSQTEADIEFNINPNLSYMKKKINQIHDELREHKKLYKNK